MNSSVVASPRRDALPLAPGQRRERSVRRRVGLTWGLLFLNTLTFYGATWNGLPLLVPIPHRIGQLITQGALLLALLLALSVNRRVLIRPNVFLCLLSLLVIAALAASIQPSGHVIGTLYRTFRLAGFVATLWLLTPWWGRRDMLLAKYHLTLLSIVVGSVLLGLLIAPGRALTGGRLSGTLWPMPPTEVADYAAVMIGLVAVLWLCGLRRGRRTFIMLALAGTVLLLTHARTELIGMMTGLLIAGLSLFTGNVRVRKVFAAGSVAASVGLIVFSGLVASWLARGQKGQQLTDLSGRTTVWSAVAGAPRSTLEAILGHGLSSKSFDGFPIDGTWITAYWDLGFLGVAICAMLLLFVYINAYLQPRSPQRALALFLVTYLLIRSVTETTLADASVNLLELALAASLLLPPLARGWPGKDSYLPPQEIFQGARW